MSPESTPMRAAPADRFAGIGLAFLACYAALFVVPFVFLAFGVGVAGWMAPLAVAAAAVGWYCFVPNARPRDGAVAFAVVGGLLLVGVLVALAFYDASIDGRFYHQVAIIRLADGWNPISDAYPGFASGSQYIRSYPKAFWYASAALYDLTGSVEIGKASHVLALGASFFLPLSLMTRLRVRPVLAWVGATVAAANPIWLLQSLTFYLDGQIASLLTAALAAGILLVVRAGSRIATASLALSLFLVVNLKFTGLLYAGLILLMVAVALAGQGRWGELRTSAAVYGLVLAAAIAVVGFNPYVQNVLDFGHPLYPVYGERSIDFISTNTPRSLRGEGQITQLKHGIFGEPGNQLTEPTRLAVPFSPGNLDSPSPYIGPDVRIAGWGPLFSGALVLSLAGVVWFYVRQRDRGPRLLVGLVVLFLIGSVIVHPEGWWARYTPQLWLVPVVVMVAAWALASREGLWVGGVLGLVLAANLALVAHPYLQHNARFTDEVRRMYEPFHDGSAVMAVHLSQFSEATRVQMEEAGVRFEEYLLAADLPCPAPATLANDAGVYCPPSG